MTFDEYEEKALRTNTNSSNGEKELIVACLGLAGEVGEVIEHVKKWQEGKRPLVLDALLNEAGDVLWYLAKLHYAVSILGGRIHSLGDTAINNIEKLERRYDERNSR